jgi:hypothetical protein
MCFGAGGMAEHARRATLVNPDTSARVDPAPKGRLLADNWRTIGRGRRRFRAAPGCLVWTTGLFVHLQDTMGARGIPATT